MCDQNIKRACVVISVIPGRAGARAFSRSPPRETAEPVVASSHVGPSLDSTRATRSDGSDAIRRTERGMGSTVVRVDTRDTRRDAGWRVRGTVSFRGGR